LQYDIIESEEVPILQITDSEHSTRTAGSI